MGLSDHVPNQLGDIGDGRALATDVVKALQGANAKKVIIGLGRKLELNGKSEFIDPWGNALRFYFSDNSVLVRSAGANRRFEESTSMEFDDYIRSN